MTEPCPRRAWLTLGSLSVDLEDYAGGWFCGSLDLGFPEVRDVTQSNPDAPGITDRTAYGGGRTVTAEVSALAGAGATIDAVAASFAPFMDPGARPTLHYVLDRPGWPERVIANLRAAGYAWPIVGPDIRDIQLQWVAPDPAVRDPATKTVTAWSGSSSSPGRTYPLTFNRTYPAGGGGATTGRIENFGDLPIRAVYRIYGPVTSPVVSVNIPGSGPFAGYKQLIFVAGTIIAAGQWVDVDTATKTVYWNSDPTSSAAAQFNWSQGTWPVIPVTARGNLAATVTLSGSSTSGVTQVQAIWQDGYLT